MLVKMDKVSTKIVLTCYLEKKVFNIVRARDVINQLAVLLRTNYFTVDRSEKIRTETEDSHEGNKKDASNPFVSRISFEDLKEEVRLMPTFPPPDFVRTGSNDSDKGTRPGISARTR